MQVNHRAHGRLVCFSAFEGVIDGQEMRCGQIVDPFNKDAFPAAGFNCRPRKRSVESPKACWIEITMEFRLSLPHRNPVVRDLRIRIGRARAKAFWRQHSWKGERIDERREFAGVEHEAYRLRLHEQTRARRKCECGSAGLG